MEHWEIVSNGQIVIDTTAEELWENACSYFKFCDDNPIVTKGVVSAGKEVGKQYNIHKKRPYTIKALCLQCGISQEYLSDMKNMKARESEYGMVVDKILNVIYTQNLEHAMTGEFNPQLTARVLNMEKEETNITPPKVEYIYGLPPLASSENEILEKLESQVGTGEITKEQNL